MQTAHGSREHADLPISLGALSRCVLAVLCLSLLSHRSVSCSALLLMLVMRFTASTGKDNIKDLATPVEEVSHVLGGQVGVLHSTSAASAK